MSKQVYGWKRFWCSRSGTINLADGGYLYDPDTEWGKVSNPDLVTLEAIADIPCLVLLGEPGIGKSQEMENLQALTKKRISEPEKRTGNPSKILELNLRSCTNLKDDLFKDKNFIDWLGDTYHLYLFLDSLDEGMLNILSLATGLIDELKKQKYQNHINRLHLRLACRTFVFPAILEEGLKKIWQKDHFEIYELAPLRRRDVVEAVQAQGLSPDVFLKEVENKNVVPLAIKPITLEFLLNIYRRHDGHFPPNQKRHELYFEGCKLLCEETNESRRGSNRVGNFDSDQRLRVAARIAAITVFANRFAVWSGVDQGDVPTEDVTLQTLCPGYENANAKEFDITRKVVEEVLDTSLFSSRGLHRTGWAHQTYAEFLAAWYLTHHKLNLSQIFSLVFHPDGRVIPQLQETTAWLASMRSDVFQQVMETDPDVLLQSDLTTADEADKEALVEALLKLHDQEKLSRNYYNHWRYRYLSYSALSEQLSRYICDRHKSISARSTAIDIIEACSLAELGVSLANIALAPQEFDQVRLNAAIAVCEIGDETAKAKLKPLAVLKSRNELEDELKGCGLRATWPNHITIEEVFNTLFRPKSNAIGGRYQDFISLELGQSIHFKHLLFALRWIKNQPLSLDSKYPFGYLQDAILLKAWEYLDDPETLKEFSKIALNRLKNYGVIIDNDSLKSEESFDYLLKIDSKKRHQLVEAMISLCTDIGEGFSYIAHFHPETVSEQDFSWLIEKLKSANSKSLQKEWAKLIRAKYREDNFDHVDTILTESRQNSVLKEVFSDRINAIYIDSLEAKEAREWQKRLAKMEAKKYLDPPPNKRVLNALADFEAGHIAAWCDLCHEMTLMPTSTHYGDLFKSDLTNLPGWKEASEDTQSRLLEAAKAYLVQGNPETEQWLGTTSYRHSALAGYKALQLLLKTAPHFISTLSTEVWRKWTPIILAYPLAGSKEDYQHRWELCQRAYKQVPSDFVHVLVLLMDKENAEFGQIYITGYVKGFWDDNLALTILNKLKDAALTTKSIKVLLEDLLQHGNQEAKAFAASLIVSPLPISGKAREKAVVAAYALMIHTEDAGWATIWPSIQNNPEFGRQVLESVSFATKYKGHVDQRLNEKCLADLYIFLMKQYPNEKAEEQKALEDKESINFKSHIISPEDSVRIWKDYIPQRLQERGTQEACAALKQIIHELPELKDKIKWRLLEAEALTRRQTWQPPTPEDILQLVSIQKLPESDLHDRLKKIDLRTQKMANEPKVDRSINFINSKISGGVNTGSGKIENKTEPSNVEKKFDWLSMAVTITVALISVAASGVFNDEIKNFLLNRNTSPQIEQKLEK